MSAGIDHGRGGRSDGQSSPDIKTSRHQFLFPPGLRSEASGESAVGLRQSFGRRVSSRRGALGDFGAPSINKEVRAFTTALGARLLPQLGIHLGSGIVAAIISATIGALLLLLILRLAYGRGRW